MVLLLRHDIGKFDMSETNSNNYVFMSHDYTDWQFFHEPEMVTFFQYLVANCDFKAVKDEGEGAYRGELVTTFDKVSGECGLSCELIEEFAMIMDLKGEIKFDTKGDQVMFYLVVRHCPYET